MLRPLGGAAARPYHRAMTRITLIALLLALAPPAFADPNTEKHLYWADWIEVCTTDKSWKWSDEERLKVCLLLEQQLRHQGRCMYSPKVLGIWDGKHCR